MDDLWNRLDELTYPEFCKAFRLVAAKEDFDTVALPQKDFNRVFQLITNGLPMVGWDPEENAISSVAWFQYQGVTFVVVEDAGHYWRPAGRTPVWTEPHDIYDDLREQWLYVRL